MERNLSVESLRVILMFLIVILHLSARVFTLESQGDTWQLIQLHALRSIGILGVSTFSFISGYYGVKFNLQKFLRYEFMALFWGIFFCVLGILVLGKFNYRMLFPLASDELWYFSGYMVLMILSPLINLGLKQISKQQFVIIIIVLLTVVYGAQFLLRYGVGRGLLIILTIYLLGQYMRRYPIAIFDDKPIRITLFFLTLHVTTTTVLSVYLLNKFNSLGGVILMQSNHNPLVILSAIGLFFSFKKMEVFRLPYVYRLAPYMFGTYVIHALALQLNVIQEWRIHRENILFLICVSLLVLLVCAIIEFFRVKLFQKLEMNLVGRFERMINKWWC